MDYFFQIFTLAVIYAIPTIGLNLIMGRTKMLSLAQTSFLGVGAYAVAIFSGHFHINFFIAALLGIALSAVISFFLGIILSKLSEDYYFLGTLGFVMIFYNIVRNWDSFTGGAYGIAGIPRPEIFGFYINTVFFYFIFSLIVCGLVYWIALFLEKSSFGRVLNAIRDDEEALKIFGYKTHHYKLIVFVIGSSMASIAGSLFAGYITYIDPGPLFVSVLFWAMIIIGGLGSLRGAVLGAIIVTLLPEIFRFIGFPAAIAGDMRGLLYGLAIVLLMLVRPKGILGNYKV